MIASNDELEWLAQYLFVHADGGLSNWQDSSIRPLYFNQAREILLKLEEMGFKHSSVPETAPSSPREASSRISSESLRKARELEYGPPSVSFPQLGKIWAAILSAHFSHLPNIPDIPGYLAALMMSAVKMCRIAYPQDRYKEDSFIDMKAYIDLAWELREDMEKPE